MDKEDVGCECDTYIYVCMYMYTHISPPTHIHTGLLFSNEKEEILLFATTWMKLKDIMFTKISQTEEDKYCMISLMCKNLKKKKSQIYRNRVK